MSHRKPERKNCELKNLPRSGDYCRTACFGLFSTVFFPFCWLFCLPHTQSNDQRERIFFFFFASVTAKKKVPPRSFPTRGNAGGMTYWDRFRSHFLMKEDKQIKKKFLRDFPEQRENMLKWFYFKAKLYKNGINKILH